LFSILHFAIIIETHFQYNLEVGFCQCFFTWGESKDKGVDRIVYM
jgi:hypothetical protein